MMRITLNHYKTGSTITLFDDNKHMGSIVYTRKIHEYESESDYDRIVTEMYTYGDSAAMEEYNRVRQARRTR